MGGESLYKLPIHDPGSASLVRLPEPISGADGVVWTRDGQLAIVANKVNRVVLFSSADEWSSAELAGIAPYESMATTVAVVGGRALRGASALRGRGRAERGARRGPVAGFDARTGIDQYLFSILAKSKLTTSSMPSA